MCFIEIHKTRLIMVYNTTNNGYNYFNGNFLGSPVSMMEWYKLFLGQMPFQTQCDLSIIGKKDVQTTWSLLT